MRLRMPKLPLIRIAVVLAAALVGYLLFSTSGGVLLSQRLGQDKQELSREIEELREQRADLEAIRDYLRSDEYIEGMARRLLGLVRPGETLVIVSSSTPPTPTPEHRPGDAEGRPWWEAIYGP